MGSEMCIRDRFRTAAGYSLQAEHWVVRRAVGIHVGGLSSSLLGSKTVKLIFPPNSEKKAQATLRVCNPFRCVAGVDRCMLAR